MFVAESSLITTAPAELNVSVSALNVFPASSPMVIDDPEKLALFRTAMSPVVPSETAPVAETMRSPAESETASVTSPEVF